jgi:hypothetical protein
MFSEPHPFGRFLAGAALGVGLAVAAGCARERVVQGECRAVNGADVCTWVRMSGSAVVAFGATVPVRAVEDAPPEAAMAWPPVADAALSLPAEARSATGFDNLTIYWEPHGHPPGPYLVPHFDFHFNTIAGADVAAIDCADTAKPTALPVGYEAPDVDIPDVGHLVGLCVPQMGMHTLPSAELRSSEPFRRTMIVGYYHQRPIFIEPMITRALLLERRSFDMDVPVVPGAPANVREPSRFRAVFDSAGQAYDFTFSGFAGRAG